MKALTTTKNIRKNKDKCSEDLTTEETQEDHFQNRIEQHHTLLTNMSKARSVAKPRKNKLKKGTQQDDVNELNDAMLDSGVDDNVDDDGNDNIKSKPGMGVCTDGSTFN